MSESRRALIAFVEQDPELRQIAPLVRAILESPPRSLGSFVAFAELWSDLRSENRALLVLSLRADLAELPVEEIARLVGVHHRTLYKSERFKSARSRVRQLQAGSLPHGRKGDDESEADFDAWE